MSREIDERIVAMYFDNDQFEKGARQSMKTLDELKQGLDFEGVGESFQEVQKMTSKGFGLKNSTKQVGFFSKAISGMGKAAKTAFNVASMPIQALGNSFKAMEGYVGKVLGFNLASKLVNTGETIIRAFTIDPMRSGWNEYELKMDSIKTIMTGTAEQFKKDMGDAYSEETHLQAVKNALEELNHYADQTVYSFSDMTSNIGKFTNNGVKLNDAVMAMKGISNAAAAAGQGTQQASMAMYNLSQAISVGKLTTMDWKSIENANMATQQFKQTFIDMAVAMGKLERKGDQYYTKTNKHMEVTAENFRNTLAEGWADTDVITAALKVWSGDYNQLQLEAMGVPRELAMQLEELGKEAMEAATQVRTFTKMWDALKEAAQSGWSMSWELIFGDMNEAINMWSHFNERFSGWIENAANARNELLRGWRGETTVADAANALREATEDWEEKYKFEDWMNSKEDGITSIASAILEDFKKNGGDVEHAMETLRREYKLTADDAKAAVMAISNAMEDGTLSYVGKDGRIDLLAGIDSLLEGFENIGRFFGKLKSAVFGDITPETLQSLTTGFRNVTAAFADWTKNLGNSSFLQNLQVGLKGLGSLLKPIWNTVKKLVDLALSFVGPVANFLSDIFAGFGEWVGTLKDSPIWQKFEGFYKSAKELIKVKVGGWFKKAGTDIRGFFSAIGTKDQEWFNKKGMPKVGTFLINLGRSISSAWSTVVGWSGWSAVGNFLKDVYGWILSKATAAYTAVSSLFKEGADGSDSPIVTFLKGIYENVKEAWNTVIGWDGWSEVGNFLKNATGWIVDKATIAYETVANLFREGADGSDSPIVTFLKGLTSKVEEAWNIVIGWSGWSEVGNFLKNATGWIVDKATAGYEAVSNLFKEGADGSDSPVVTFLKGLYEKVEGAWSDVVGWPGWSEVGGFLKNAYGWIVDKATAGYEEVSNLFKEGADGSDSPVVTFLKGLTSKVEEAWNAVIGWSGWSEVGNFLKNATGWIADKATNAYEAISNLFKEGADGSESPVVTFLNGLASKVKEAWNAVIGWDGWAEVGNFLKNATGWIVDKATAGYEAVSNLFKEGADGSDSPIVTFLTGIKTNIEEAWGALWSFLQTEGPKIGQFISDAFGFLVGLIAPSANAEADPGNVGEAVVEAIPELTPEQTQEIEDKLSLFDRLTKTLSDFVNSVGEWSGWDAVSGFFTDLFGSIKDLFKSLSETTRLSQIGRIIDKTFSLILDIVETVVDFGKKLVDGDFMSWVGVIVAAIGSTGFKLLSSYLMGKVGSFESLGEQMLKMAGAIMLIAVAVGILGSLDEGTLLQGGAAVVVLGIVLAKVMAAMTEFRKAAPEKKDTTTVVERLLSQLIRWVGIAGAIATTMALLPGVIDAVDKAGLTGDDVLKLMEGLSIYTGAIAALALVSGVLAKLDFPSANIIGVSAAISLSMVVLAAGLLSVVSMIGGLMGQFPDDSIAIINNFSLFMNKLGEAIGGLVGSYKGSKQANQAGAALVGMSKFAEVADTIDEAKLEKFKRMMEMVKVISESIPTENTIWEKLFGGGTMSPGALKDFLSGLGLGMQEFVNSTKDIEDSALANATKVVEFLQEMMIVANLTRILNGFGADMAGLNLLPFIEALSDPKSFQFDGSLEEAVDNASAFAITINDAIVAAAPEIDVVPLIDAIANGISGEDSKTIIKNAFTSLGNLLAGEGVELPTADVTGGGNLFSGLFSMLDTFNLGDYTSELNKMLGEFDPETLTNKLGIGDVFDMSDTGLSTQINEMMTAMQAQLDSGEYNLGVQMVPEWTNGDPPSWWGGDAPMSIKGEVSIVPTDLLHVTNMLNTIRNSIDVKGNEIVIAVNNLGSRINNLGDRVDGISDAIANMQFVLDTGVIAGAVDRRLGKQVAIESRAGGGGR